MEFFKGDIQIKNGTTWISQRLVSSECNISDDYLRTAVRFRYKKSVQPCHRHHNILPVTGKSWRYAKINNTFYYDLSTIPDRSPTFYRSLFGDSDKLLELYNESINNKANSLFEIQFKEYLNRVHTEYLFCYVDAKLHQQTALAKACAVLEFCVLEVSNENLSVNEISKAAALLIDKYNLQYLPKNYRRLKEKIEDCTVRYIPIAEVIHLPRSGNNFAEKHVDPEVKSWAMQLRSMGQNYTNEHIIRQVQNACRITGKSVPSRRWFGKNIFELHKTKFLTASSRFGAGTTRASVHESYIPIKNALFAGDCWQIDATRVNMIPHTTAEGKKDFLFIIAVRDVHSGEILGYNFDYSENRWSVHNAIKMAVEQAGYLPYDFVCDRFPGHNTPEIKRLFEDLERLGTNVTITHNATGKAQLERWFGTLQTVFMQSSEYYYGEGIKSSNAHAHRSPDYLKAVKKMARAQGFDLNDAYKESAMIVEAYRNTSYSSYSRKNKQIHETPKQLHEKSEKPHVNWLNEAKISMIFGLKKKLKVANNGLISTDIQKVEHFFKVEDYDIFSENAEVVISYDLNDLSKVYLFKAKNRFLIHLGEAKAFQPVQMYGPQKEYGRLTEEKGKNKAIQTRKETDLQEATGEADETALLMGRLTQKGEANEAESLYFLNESKTQIPLKKVGGGDNTTDLSDDPFNILNQL